MAEEIRLPKFTKYQKFIVAILAFLQFTIILDFMILSPLSAILIPELKISASQFGLVVSSYAFSAGTSGFLAASFADKFDRKRMLLFFYTGFILGTFFCGIAPNYELLLIARIVTGLFGGVISSISFAIVTDLFDYRMRGRVMGIVQTAFASSQVLGLPIGLYLANLWNWHAPFILVATVASIVWVVVVFYMQPIDAHLKLQTDRRAFQHLIHTLSQPQYLKGFAATALLATGGFMIMPFASAFNVHNLGILLSDLPYLYLVTGIVSMIGSPMIGILSDRLGAYKVFVMGSLLTVVLVSIYTRLSPITLPVLMAVSSIMFLGVSARIVSSSALISMLPSAADRGAYMSIGSSIQQVSGGVAAAFAGFLVLETPDGSLMRFDWVGNAVAVST
ncbi:MAG: MFS transporter, partial [Bdellovibrionales bacterium]|nr:MFS transporter [Bdellovibrionales bacterium]